MRSLEHRSVTRSIRLVSGAIVALGVGVLAAPRSGEAQSPPEPGSPDPSFGGNGRVLISFPDKATDEATCVVIQPDGKILVGGTTNSPVSAGEQNFAIFRLNPDGSVDESFATNGGLAIGFPNGTEDRASSLALQADGKILLAGTTNSPIANGDNNFAVVRLNADGSLDTSFGTNGATITDFRQNSNDQLNAIAVQQDGNIVAAGFSDAPNGDSNFALVRYTPDGQVDPTFGDSTLNPGRVLTDFGQSSRDEARAMVLQPDGKIVTAGFTQREPAALFDVGLIRYLPNGTPDPAFGSGGRVVTDIRESADDARAVALQADGKIVTAGASNAPNGEFNFAIIRYNPDGSIDAPFGQSELNPGISLIDFDNQVVDGELKRSVDQANAVAIQSNGQIVAAGFSTAPLGVGNTNFALVRLDTNGVANTGFGPNNRVLTDLDNTTRDHVRDSSTDRANALAIQADGKIVAAGGADAPVSNANLNFALVRYVP